MTTITGGDIQKMVQHWLECPINGYLGSDYGQDAKSLLQLPTTDGAPEAYLAKLRADVQAVYALPPGAINLYGVHSPPDRLDLVIEVAGQTITIGSL